MKVIFHRGNIKPYYRSLGKDTFLSKKQETLVDPKASDSTPMTQDDHTDSFPIHFISGQETYMPVRSSPNFN